MMENVIGQFNKDLYERGVQFAKERGSNSLETLTELYTGGDINRVIKNGVDEVYVKNENCIVNNFSNISNENDNYRCGCDNSLVEGFNINLGCEVIRSVESGCNLCIHRLYIK
jgi:hypothetical protein